LENIYRKRTYIGKYLLVKYKLTFIMEKIKSLYTGKYLYNLALYWKIFINFVELSSSNGKK